MVSVLELLPCTLLDNGCPSLRDHENVMLMLLSFVLQLKLRLEFLVANLAVGAAYTAQGPIIKQKNAINFKLQVVQHKLP